MKSFPPLSILVADDEPAIRHFVAELLTGERHETHLAADGLEALKMLESRAFDMVLTDLEMPGMGGFELVRRMNGMDRAPLSIIMTGDTTFERAIEAMRMGAYDYLVKPFKADDVIRVIKKASDKIVLQRENVQLRQTVELYKLSETLELSHPVDEILARTSEALVGELGLDIACVYLQDESQAPVIRNVSSRLAQGKAEILLLAFDIEGALERFQTEKALLASGPQARSFFLGAHSVESLIATPFRSRNEVIGALVGVSCTPGRRLHEGDRRLLSVLASRAAAAVDIARLFTDQGKTITAFLGALTTALEQKDQYTAGHSKRVERWAEIIATVAGVPERELRIIKQAALLHDIGKIGVREGSLTKAGKLTPDEFDAQKEHSIMGKRILERLKFLGPVAEFVHHHHERYDGTGYPDGLRGEEISLGARVLCLADSFEVMTTDRSYRGKLNRDEALAELRRCAGHHFDARLVALFAAHLESFPTFAEAMNDSKIGAPERLIAEPLDR